MPNKTIYVRQKDTPLFEQAKEIAGEALSSVIVKALSEFVARNKEKKKGVKEISLKVGIDTAQREQRFMGMRLGDWKGFSNDRQWYLAAAIYRTQKDNWAVFIETICKASLFTNKKAWKENGEYLINPKRSDLLVGKTPEELKKKLPDGLYLSLIEHARHEENPVEYLDI
jgi:EXLDI family protein